MLMPNAPRIPRNSGRYALLIKTAKARPDLTIRQLGGMTGYSYHTVAGLLSQYRKAGGDLPRRRSEVRRGRIETHIPVSAFDHLQSSAGQRGLSVEALCTELLTAIANDDLVSAILEDG